MIKGFFLLAIALSLLGSRAAIPQSNDDLWDLSKGVVVTAKSPTLDTSTGMFGGTGYSPEPFGTTIFTGGNPHYIEWRTPAAVTISKIRLFAHGDNGTSFRTFSKFTLKIKGPGSSAFNQTVLTWDTATPFVVLDTSSYLILDRDLPEFTASEFRAEFVPVDGGSRVIELDAFGPVPTTPAAITSQPVSQSVLAGTSAQFNVGVSGTQPIAVEWRRAGNPVTLSERIKIIDGHDLLISNVTADDAGAYTVRVSNQWGFAESNEATLTVTPDTQAPLVGISTPTGGVSLTSKLTLAGIVSDNVAVATARWERNGVASGALTLTDGSFSIPVTIQPGETRLKVIAVDGAGNEGSSEVVVTLSPSLPSDDDLWDVSRGTLVTGASGVFPEETPGLFGGTGMAFELGHTIFSDNQSAGFTHFVEWITPNPVTVSTVRLYAGGDGATYSHGREIGRFTLKTKSPGSSTFDVTVFSFVPQHPYVLLDASTYLILDTNFPPFTSREFRGEFEQIDLRAEGWNAPRVIELDAFGPAVGGPPQIVNQPASREGFVGANATFIVGATGAAPLTYQWRHAGTNLIESVRFTGVNSWSLMIQGITQEDAGAYSVLVENSLDAATSADAILTVNVDSTSPAVTIASPVAGTQQSQTFTLAGTVQEANALDSVRWELNTRAMGTLRITGNQFSLANQTFEYGENRIKVFARDSSGNEGVAEVIVNWTVPRLFALGRPAAVQEGLRVVVPISLMSTGGVGGATLAVNFDPNYLADVQFEWSEALINASTSTNIQNATPPNSPSFKQLRASFALPGIKLPEGNVSIGVLSFRARSVPNATNTTQLRLELAGVFSDEGDEYVDNNSTQNTSATISRRKVTGDGNANDRLDVGDATVILRLASRADVPRNWDRALNDLNKNLDVDAGDVTKVLRAVVGLDPQPTVPGAPAPAMKAAAVISPDNLPGMLVANKSTGAAGDKITVEVRISGQTKPISGASFRLEYPADALRLENASALQVGAMVPVGSPNGAVSIWNVSPNQNYSAQNGVVSLGVSSPAAWSNNNGTLAQLTFTVQPGAAARYGWPVTLKNLEISRDGFQTEVLGNGQFTFLGHPAGEVSLQPSITFSLDGKPTITLRGDAGASYLIEASSDLSTWSTVGTYYSNSGSVQFEDGLAGGASARFYRATLQGN